MKAWKGKSLKEKILQLHQEGKSYNEIASLLNCAKSTVSYHCDPKGREKVYNRSQKYKLEDSRTFYLKKRISNFKNRKRGSGRKEYDKDWNKKLRTAVSEFRKSLKIMPTNKYTYKDVIDRFGLIVECELTGRTIDLTKDDYNIDHIIPIDRGGTNELENMAFTIPEANAAKNNLTNDEFVALCKEVCEHFGYTVTKE